MIIYLVGVSLPSNHVRQELVHSTGHNVQNANSNDAQHFPGRNLMIDVGQVQNGHRRNQFGDLTIEGGNSRFLQITHRADRPSAA